MKKLKKFGKSSFAVVLSLVLCAGMVVPAFAAVEFNKDAHVDAATGALKQNEAGDYDYYLGGNVTLDKTLVIGAGVGANIDLNGYTLQLNDTHSSTGSASSGLGDLKVEDSSKADKTAPTDRRKWGSVIQVAGEGADLTVTDSSAIDEETGEYVAGKGTGSISGGYAGNSMGADGGGAGVRVSEGGSFTMKGGSISENLTQNGHGGGIYVNNGTVNLDNVAITRNSVSSYGGGIYAEKNSTVTMKNTDISQNRGMKNGNGVAADGSTVTLVGSTITSNRYSSSVFGGGIYAVNGAKVDVTDSVVSNNSTKSAGGGIYSSKSDITLNGSDVSGNTCSNGVGGIYAQGGSLTINGGSVSKNTTTGSGSLNYGLVGGIYTKTGTDVTIGEDVTVCGNTLKGAQKQIYDPDGNIITEATHGEGGWDEGKVTKPATCKEEGKMTYTCKYCNETKTEVIEKLDHEWDEGKVTTEPTHTMTGTKTYTCTGCGKVKKEFLDCTEEHEWGEGTVQQEASCTQEGVMVYTCTCGMSKEEPIKKLEHTPGEAVRENEVSAGYGVAGSYEEVVKCTHCGEELSRVEKEIPPLEQPDEPTPPVTPPTTPDVPGIPEEPGVTEIEDEDVPLAGLPVELAAEEPLTRGQLMAILHWMDSEPAAQLATFMDVAADHDFALAIGWAQENGIAVGVSATEFAPDQVVTRGQLINFLNRYAKYVGSDLVLEVEGNANETLTWAMAEEIINDFFARLYA